MPERIDDLPDEQDQSEVFDETHLDDEGDGEVSLDEMDDVLDVTQVEGDAGEDDLEVDEALALDGALDDPLEASADPMLEDPALEFEDQAAEPDGEAEIELVYAGLMRNVRGAQASTAHWEARRLDDDDIEALGYAPDAPDAPSDSSPDDAASQDAP